jgi:hypothetical protein
VTHLFETGRAKARRTARSRAVSNILEHLSQVVAQEKSVGVWVVRVAHLGSEVLIRRILSVVQASEIQQLTVIQMAGITCRNRESIVKARTK